MPWANRRAGRRIPTRRSSAALYWGPSLSQASCNSAVSDNVRPTDFQPIDLPWDGIFYGRALAHSKNVRSQAPSSFTGTRSCCPVSRWRTVTLPSVAVSVSTVTHNGVPTSSWRA